MAKKANTSSSGDDARSGHAMRKPTPAAASLDAPKEQITPWRGIKDARQRMVLCRLMIDIMRSVHGAYAPPSESFGGRLETLFIGLCVALGEIEERPFSVAKIAGYMRMPRTTVIRRLEALQSWGVIYRQGHRYYMKDNALNSLFGMRSYRNVRAILDKATNELSILDTLPDYETARPPLTDP